MKAWVHLEDGIVKGAMLETVDRAELARELGEWVLDGVTPILHDFGDEPLRINMPLPLPRQGLLPLEGDASSVSFSVVTNFYSPPDVIQITWGCGPGISGGGRGRPPSRS